MEFTEDKYLCFSALTKIEAVPTSIVKAASQNLGVQGTWEVYAVYSPVQESFDVQIYANWEADLPGLLEAQLPNKFVYVPFNWEPLCKRRPLRGHQPTGACRCRCGGTQQV